jgi:hypothetical protein
MTVAPLLTIGLNQLRGIKTPEELFAKEIHKDISLARQEAMRAVNPRMSERELEELCFMF